MVESIVDLLRSQAAKTPDQLAAIVDGISQITYGEWGRLSNRLGRKLAGLGLEKGDRVALLFNNAEAVSFMVGYFAVHKAGGVIVPINTRLAAGEISYILSNSEAVGALGEASVAAKLEAARKNAPCVRWAALKGAGGELDLDELLKDGDDSEFAIPCAADDLCDILYTSGTTGFPKGVACTHGDVISLGGSGGLDKMFGGRAFLHAVPLFTFAGTHAMMMTPLKAGMTSIIQPRFDAGRFLALIEQHKVVLSYAVPSMIVLALQHPDIETHDYSSLQMLMYGTAPMPPEAVRKLGEICPKTMLLNVYGLTEGGGAACSLPPFEAKKRPGSIGRPLPGTELKIITEEGNEAAPNEVGEIRMRGKHRRRYFNNEEASSDTWTEDGWLKTGDLGYLDEDGYLYISGRNKDMIIRGGFNVYPVEIEAALHEHPEILEVAVIGVPHDVLGEDIKACIVARPGANLSEDDIAKFCEDRLADYKRPRQIEFMAELPRNALGKVLKRSLRGGSDDQSGTGLAAEA
ncbi:MAG: AMP-binding protein [Chrysiogenetes bacterium]|nr:AMP-binding protein [Chrysiogenetes bacterium]